MIWRHSSDINKSPAKDLETRLQETVQRYQLVFRATNDVLYELNIETQTALWNEALFTQYGYDPDQSVLPLSWWAQHVHPDDALRVQDEISEWFEGDDETWHSEYRFQKADGTYVNVRDRGVVQRNERGEPVRVIGSLLDITRQKQLDSAKDEFISLVSHQLRTPLTAIRLYSEMLSNDLFGELDDKQREPVQHITDAAIRLIDLVGTILDISKLESGHMVAEPTPANINELLQMHISEVMPLADHKNIKVIFHPDDSVGDVSVDVLIFGQVIHNLLTNSIRYTRSGNGLVEVVFARNENGYILTVKDNGIGIPESAHSSIFNRFFRASNAVSVEEQGTGLGLYMIKLMIESAGCDVWFESHVDHGTTFFVQLPSDGMRAGGLVKL